MHDTTDFFQSLRLGDRGLVPAIVQDADTNQVLMHVVMNPEAIERTFETGCLHYYSTKMRKVWQKGESSGHRQLIRSVRVSCEGDSLLFLVEPKGGACEEGYHTCFHKEWRDGAYRVIEEKVFDPELVYPEFAFSH